jgi:hypothetical protein
MVRKYAGREAEFQTFSRGPVVGSGGHRLGLPSYNTNCEKKEDLRRFCRVTRKCDTFARRGIHANSIWPQILEGAARLASPGHATRKVPTHRQ